MAINGKLFEYAGQAAKKTNNAITEETALTNVPANMTTDGLIDKFTTGETETYGYNSQTNTFVGIPNENNPNENTTFTEGYFTSYSDYNDYKEVYGTPESTVYLCWYDSYVEGIGVSGYPWDLLTEWYVYNPSGELVAKDKRNNHQTGGFEPVP